MGLCFYVLLTEQSHTGTIQDIWNYIIVNNNVKCFRNDTALTNYADIPTLWK